MKIIIYHERGLAISDFAVEQLAKTFLLSDSEDGILVSTENFINAIRVLIHEGIIDCNLVEFRFKEHCLKPDKNGRFDNWPTGFCDTTENFLSRLLNNEK